MTSKWLSGWAPGRPVAATERGCRCLRLTHVEGDVLVRECLNNWYTSLAGSWQLTRITSSLPRAGLAPRSPLCRVLHGCMSHVIQHSIFDTRWLLPPWLLLSQVLRHCLRWGAYRCSRRLMFVSVCVCVCACCCLACGVCCCIVLVVDVDVVSWLVVGARLLLRFPWLLLWLLLLRLILWCCFSRCW